MSYGDAGPAPDFIPLLPPGYGYIGTTAPGQLLSGIAVGTASRYYRDSKGIWAHLVGGIVGYDAGSVSKEGKSA